MLSRDEKKLSENYFTFTNYLKPLISGSDVFFKPSLTAEPVSLERKAIMFACMYAKVVCSTHLCKLRNNKHEILTLPIIYHLSIPAMHYHGCSLYYSGAISNRFLDMSASDPNLQT